MRLAQQRDRGLRDEEETAQVDPDLQVEVLCVQVLDRAGNSDAGRVDEDIEPAECLAMLGDGARAFVRVADVCGECLRPELGRGCLDRRPACARSPTRCPTTRR
jgi:hypothetical protein